MTYIDTVWEVQCVLYYRPSIDKTRESAAVTMHNATLSDFVNALCNGGRREERKSYLQTVRGSHKASEGQANV
jgi:hypothetical protein